MSVWYLPVLIVVTTVLFSIPVGLYLAWIMDGRYRAPRWLALGRARLDTGPQNWKQYAVALLLFNTRHVRRRLRRPGAAAVRLPLNPDDKRMLAPDDDLQHGCSFLTNTNLQHYSGEVHLSYFSQIVFVVWNMFVSAAVGFCALAAIIRGLRGDAHMGNFYLDMWRVVVYVFLPASLIMGVLLHGRRRADDVRQAAGADGRDRAMGTTTRASPAADDRPRPGGGRSCRSSTSAPTAAASSAPTPPTPSRTPAPGPTSSNA